MKDSLEGWTLVSSFCYQRSVTTILNSCKFSFHPQHVEEDGGRENSISLRNAL